MLSNSTEVVSFNYTLTPKSKFKTDYKGKSGVAYEVIRLVNGIPLFLDQHCNRLLNSLATVEPGFKPDKVRLEKSILELIWKNNFSNTNIRIDIFGENILIYGIQSYYPSEKDFEQGVRVTLTSLERKNPKEKIYRELWKKDVEQRIADAKVFELLLVNKQGLITEGSRSNVFFIRDNILFSPDESLILPGITRSEIMKVAKVLGLLVEHAKIDKANLLSFDAAFLCGTSIKILPIAEIDELSFNVNNTLLRKIQLAFNEHFEKEYRKSIKKWRK